MLARSGNSQSYDVDFSHVVSLSAFTRNFMLHENFHTNARGSYYPTERPDTMSKNSSRGIRLSKRPEWGITEHLLLILS